VLSGARATRAARAPSGSVAGGSHGGGRLTGQRGACGLLSNAAGASSGAGLPQPRAGVSTPGRTPEACRVSCTRMVRLSARLSALCQCGGWYGVAARLPLRLCRAAKHCLDMQGPSPRIHPRWGALRVRYKASFRPGQASIVALQNRSRPSPTGGAQKARASLDRTCRAPPAGNCLAGKMPQARPARPKRAAPVALPLVAAPLPAWRCCRWRGGRVPACPPPRLAAGARGLARAAPAASAGLARCARHGRGRRLSGSRGRIIAFVQAG